MPDSLDIRRKRLLYQSRHRGMQETDRLLGGFAGACLAALDEAQLDRFEALLQASDNDLFNWLSGREAVPEAFDDDVMAMIKNFNKEIYHID